MSRSETLKASGGDPPAKKIAFDGGDVEELRAALAAAPLSPALRRRLWDELFDLPGLHEGPEGVTYCADVTALGISAGQVTVHAKLGRAGVALTLALRALSGTSLDEISLHGGVPSERMVAAGMEAFFAYDSRFDADEDAVRRVWLAMARAAKS